MTATSIRPSVSHLAIGTILGLVAGALFERSSLIQMVSGSSACMAAPGSMTTCDSHAVTGVFISAGGILGGSIGAIVGITKEGMRANRKWTKLVIAAIMAIIASLLLKH